MSRRFLLFGERPFEAYVHDKFSDIAVSIEKMSDVEVLLYKDAFGDLLKKTFDSYRFPDLNISFENKMVDLVKLFDAKGAPNFFAEYSLVVAGNPYYLGLTPFNSAYLPVELPFSLRGNVMSFEINTFSATEELSPEATALVKQEYTRIKKFILKTQASLNETISFFNSEMEKLITKHLANKLRKAERCMKIKATLNFN